MTSVAAEFEHMEIQQQFSDGVNNRWDADDWDNENSSARLFERSRIKALAGRSSAFYNLCSFSKAMAGSVIQLPLVTLVLLFNLESLILVLMLLWNYSHSGSWMMAVWITVDSELHQWS